MAAERISRPINSHTRIALGPGIKQAILVLAADRYRCNNLAIERNRILDLPFSKPCGKHR
ncbi:hypothetical protein DPMN_098076 [Dreissena polymorpha]|uniref:Uncharacterized protein n=1 Tax=Dreissena polymorpha TaxID=45954 RepID=A0A9D4KVW2_DREPO|nr:hypothetical protein DPMN_088276 [Dreissena polymorpha]KAH3855508.1 hypothetical protein DPMN_098076 [Dreissena polymorpha]